MFFRLEVQFQWPEWACIDTVVSHEMKSDEEDSEEFCMGGCGHSWWYELGIPEGPTSKSPLSPAGNADPLNIGFRACVFVLMLQDPSVSWSKWSCYFGALSLDFTFPAITLSLFLFPPLLPYSGCMVTLHRCLISQGSSTSSLFLLITISYFALLS